MPRGPMSAEARKKIATAQRKRWAAHRAAAGGTQSTPSATATKRRGRPPRQYTAGQSNPFMDMTIQALVDAKRNIDEAWNQASALFGSGGQKRGRGRPRKS